MNMREKIAAALADWHHRHIDFEDGGPYPSTFIDGAAAVLDAMEEPTEGMMEAGGKSHMEGVNYHGPAWTAMIRAAKEGK